MKKILNLLGLCARAGFVKSGEAFSEKAIKAGAAKLALMDESASPSSKRAIEVACAANDVPLIFVPPEAVGAAIGKPGRMAAVVLDDGFARRMVEINQTENKSGGH